ncbi:MAG: hypothetical protein AAB215_09175 [Planctomycetota bacterium]
MAETRRVVFSRLFYIVGAGLTTLLLYLITQDQAPDPLRDKVYEPLTMQAVYVPFFASALALLLAISLSRRESQSPGGHHQVSLPLSGSSFLLIMVSLATVVWWQTSAPGKDRDFLDQQHTNIISDLRSQLAKMKSGERAKKGRASTDAERKAIDEEVRHQLEILARMIGDENADYGLRIIRWEERNRIY